MSAKCCGCGQEFPGAMREVSFDFRGVIVKDHVPGLKCDKCFIEQFAKDFDAYAGEVIKIENGYVTVDWEKFLAVKRKRTRWDVIIQLLEGFGILAAYYMGGWSIDVGHGSANIRMSCSGTMMLFSEKSQAMEYASHACQGSAGFEIYRQGRSCF